MKRTKRVSDERIEQELRDLNAFLESAEASNLHDRFLLYAAAARDALRWVADSNQIDPMHPMRMLSLLMHALAGESLPPLRPAGRSVIDGCQRALSPRAVP